ncbi:Flagellar assembly protein FliH [Desulfovibrio sp. DV]|uniref:SPOR domain-containing protein n=1 Tax=Desulfovibrio sp. DV TaxID=1844708 RepID=UPI00095FCAC7|nr:SPOR domain-containing protein [Desulfovibrio sp. DV]OLN27363.1 Flagellar assembly protein FliH [Desulfovibrio sp. DV]
MGLLAILPGVIGPGRALAAAGPAIALESCGALLRETGPGDGWPGGKAVRPGQTVLPGDKGLGCRFLLTGEGDGGGVAEARLARPLPGGDTVVDRWFVPVRRGEAASAVYAFAPGQIVPAGDWTLTLAAGGVALAEARFQVAADETAVAAPPAAAAVRAAASAPPTPASPPAGGGEGAPAAVPAAPSPPPSAGAPPAVPLPAPKAAPTPAPVSAPAPEPRVASGPAAAGPPTAGPAKGKPQEPAARTQGADKPAPATGYVALQTGLFADADNATAQAVRLRARGMPACLAVAGEGAKRRYRVLAGRFGDRRAAAEAQGRVKAILGLVPLVYAVDAAEASRLRCR